MDTVAVAFWGAFFGVDALMLAVSLLAFVRSLHRVALTAALSAVVSALFVVAYLGWLPVADRALEVRLASHLAAVSSAALGLMLLAMLGVLRDRRRTRRIVRGLTLLTVSVMALGWGLSPVQSLALSSGWALAIGMAALIACVRSAVRGDRLAWVAVAGVLFLLVAVSGLSWIALDGERVSWPLHAVSAMAGIAYLATMAAALWTRYSYLIELREVMAHGPAYDPVTRMRSHAETGLMLGAAFVRDESETRPVGVIVVSIGNLYALENLHGRAATNHALFVCASRLRRMVPLSVEMGRLAEDGFLLLIRNASDSQALVQLARQVAQRLGRPVALSTGSHPAALEAGETQWVADVGVGVLQAPPQVRPASAVAMGRAMSRTAWSYSSRLAWFDHQAEQIAELPAAHPG
ncbi:diguanylate cyclase [uncultured Ramlibacter sp.]|uniref:diguanylate cyclase domain-containing protein n=1 Tax=uncultured Ramlibacter sp. TaxID=260755 RepID=UPI00261E98E8|nr:diguanylate cyclase [uncultured Ramlibacter sp.]